MVFRATTSAVNLLGAVKSGDEAAVRRLFNQRSGQVYRWAVLMGLSQSDAEDAAQEVFAIALQKIDQCADDQGLTPWLYTITKNVVKNARRRVWFRRVFLSDQPLEPAFMHGQGSDPDAPTLELSVRTCLARLSADHREVLMLSDVDGYTREEIARILEIPPGTVASRLRLARGAFKKGWEEAWSTPKKK